MKQDVKKRLFKLVAWVTCLAMVVGALPTGALAAGGTMTLTTDAAVVNLLDTTEQIVTCTLAPTPTTTATEKKAVPIKANNALISITDISDKPLTTVDFTMANKGKVSFIVKINQTELGKLDAAAQEALKNTALGTITIGDAGDADLADVATVQVQYHWNVVSGTTKSVDLLHGTSKTVNCSLAPIPAADTTVPMTFVPSDPKYADYVLLYDGDAVATKLDFKTANGAKSSFTIKANKAKLDALSDSERNALKNQQIGTVRIGAVPAQTPYEIPIKYMEGVPVTVDTLTTNVPKIYLAPGQNQTLTTWISPVAAKEIDFVTAGEYKNYIQVSGASVKGNKIVYNAQGSANFMITLGTISADDLLKLKDGDKLGEITIGGENCKPVTVSVYYATQPRPLTKVEFKEKSPMPLKKGTQYNLDPKLYPESATNFELTWVSSDTAILTVDANGVVTAKSPGKATVTATANQNNAATDKLEIEVYESMDDSSGFSAVDAHNTTYAIDANGLMDTIQGLQEITVTMVPAPTEKIEWSIDNKKVATLEADKTDSSKAVLQTLQEGEALIKAKGVNSGFTRSFTIKVAAVSTTKISLSVNGKLVDPTDPALEMAKGYQTKVGLITEPDNATDKTVVWKSSDSKVVTVSSTGVIRARGAGSATVSATLKSDMGKKDANGNVIPPTILAELKITVRDKAEPIKAVKVFKAVEKDGKWEKELPEITYVNGSLNPDATIQTPGNPAPGTEGASDNPLNFKLGESKTFWVEPVIPTGQEFLVDQEIDWKILQNGYGNVTQAAIPDSGATLLTVKASNSRTKADKPVRLVATNVGEYPVANTYPEIFMEIDPLASTGIAIINAPVIVEIGKACSPIRIKTTPSNGSNKVDWKVEPTAVNGGSVVGMADPMVAPQVDKDGNLVLTGETSGKIKVTATSQLDPTVTAEVELTVSDKVKSAQLNATSIKLGKDTQGTADEDFQLVVSLLPYTLYADDIITYSSRDPYVAEVDAAGVITLYANAQIGESTYIDVMVGNQKKLSCKVTVVAKTTPSTTGVTVSAKKTDYVLAVGKSQQLGYTYQNLSADERKKVEITWELQPSDPVDPNLHSDKVVNVDGMGKVTVKNPPATAKAQIKATFRYNGVPLKTPKGENFILYTITVKPTFVIAIDGGALTEKPEAISKLAKVGDKVTLQGQVQPNGSGSNDCTFTIAGSYSKYLKVTPDAVDKSKAVVEVIAMPTKKTSAKVTIKNATTKKTVTVTIVLAP